MKKLLFTLFITSFSLASYAQTTQQHNDPNAGHFDILKTNNKGVVEHINVNYAMSPASFSNVLQLTLNTPNPMMMSVKIKDAGNHTVITWKPDQASYNYIHQFDISNLQSGTYTIEVYGPGNNKVHDISFKKSDG